jgi:vacuolar-type H+-ATPase subunit H
MKDLLRRLIEAEESGRQDAARLEAEGDRLLQAARTECENRLRDARADLTRAARALEIEGRTQIELQCQEIARRADAEIARMQSDAQGRRGAIVAELVAILLGEAALPVAGRAASGD